MSTTGQISLPCKHFGFAGAADLVSAAGLHADIPHALLTITEPTKADPMKAETTR